MVFQFPALQLVAISGEARNTLVQEADRAQATHRAGLSCPGVDLQRS